MIYRNNKRYYTLDNFYFEKFGSKVAKISLDAGFTCPNIDGKFGTGGCIYCSSKGSGDYAGHGDDLVKQFYEIKEIMDKKVFLALSLVNEVAILLSLPFFLNSR